MDSIPQRLVNKSTTMQRSVHHKLRTFVDNWQSYRLKETNFQIKSRVSPSQVELLTNMVVHQQEACSQHTKNTSLLIIQAISILSQKISLNLTQLTWLVVQMPCHLPGTKKNHGYCTDGCSYNIMHTKHPYKQAYLKQELTST